MKSVKEMAGLFSAGDLMNSKERVYLTIKHQETGRIHESTKGMDQVKIKMGYGDKVILMCGLGTQQFLVHTTQKEVKEKTIEIIKKLGYNGEFIFAASLHIQPDTDKNIFTLFETLNNYTC
jgi:uncharacterized FAD-dependent dehydrogenase